MNMLFWMKKLRILYPEGLRCLGTPFNEGLYQIETSQLICDADCMTESFWEMFTKIHLLLMTVLVYNFIIMVSQYILLINSFY